MKKFFLQDSISVGIVTGLGSELGYCLALTIGLLVAGIPPLEHIRWYAGMYVCLILVLQRYAKLRMPKVTKTLIVTLVVTFIPFIVYLLRTNALQMQ